MTRANSFKCALASGYVQVLTRVYSLKRHLELRKQGVPKFLRYHAPRKCRSYYSNEFGLMGLSLNAAPFDVEQRIERSLHPSG